MSLTTIEDNIIPDVFAEALEAELAGLTALAGTDIVAVDSKLTTVNAKVGKNVRVPYIGHIGRAQIVGAGQSLEPTGVTDDDEESPLLRIGISIEAETLTEWANLNDPYEVGARQAKVEIERTIDEQLIAVATSTALPATRNLSAGSWPLIYDAYTTPQTLNPDILTETRFLFGDEQRKGEFAGYVMHSKSAKDLVSLKDTTGRGLYVDGTNEDLPQFMNRPLIMSDRFTRDTTLTPTKYTTALFKKNSMALWYKKQPEVLYDTDITTNTKIMAIWVYVVIHRYRVMPGLSKPGVALVVHK